MYLIYIYLLYIYTSCGLSVSFTQDLAALVDKYTYHNFTQDLAALVDKYTYHNGIQGEAPRLVCTVIVEANLTPQTLNQIVRS